MAQRQEYYLPIPSVDYRYEISKGGKIRNALTKKLITNRELRGKSVCVCFRVNGTRVRKTLAGLIWEVHGIEPKRKFPAAKTVYVSKDGDNRCFTSYRQCVLFLMTRIPRGKTWLFRRLQQRQAEICGWKIFYRDETRRRRI